MTDQKRRLAAIVCADVVGFSRLMGDDEEATVAALRDRRGVFSECIENHDGTVAGAPLPAGARRSVPPAPRAA